MKSKTTTGLVALYCLALLAAMPVAGAERAYDRDVLKLIDRANKDLGKFMGNMKRDAKGAKVTRAGVEYDVSDSLDDLKAEGSRLEERFNGDAKAAPTALAFLQKAKAFDGFVDRHPGFTGADQEWQALRPTLDSLADAYQIDWAGNPDSWQAMRSSDAELAGWAKQLDQDIKSYSSSLGQAAKEAKVEKTTRTALDTQVKALSGGSKSLQKALSSRMPAGAAFESLAKSVKSVSDQAASLGLGAGAAQAVAPLAETLAKLAGGLGVAGAAGT